MTEMPSAKGFLAAHPVGVYTCARCVPGTDAQLRVLQWRFHIERLALGLAMDKRFEDNSISDELLRTLESVTTSLKASLLQAQHDSPAAGRHGMLTVLWTCDEQHQINIHAHLCAMPQITLDDAVSVLVHGAPRLRPQCKHSQWIADRQPLEQHMRHVQQALVPQLKLSECVLHDDIGRLFEGLITNFFVVLDGAIHTAPSDGVLPGSTRAQVLAACEALQIPVVLNAPRLDELQRWSAAFLTSMDILTCCDGFLSSLTMLSSGCVRILQPVNNVVRVSDDGQSLLSMFAVPTTGDGADLVRRIRSHIQDVPMGQARAIR
ncbi:hypothetical protein PINS_up015980 [Pythium insidiosum]|nr:hypothetical protein PINS_up015980 [Pythium insidiosum]